MQPFVITIETDGSKTFAQAGKVLPPGNLFRRTNFEGQISTTLAVPNTNITTRNTFPSDHDKLLHVLVTFCLCVKIRWIFWKLRIEGEK